jgi:hypothetical protein
LDKKWINSINIGIENPINMVMDNKLGRLLIYQATTQQLIEVYEDANGNLDPKTLTIYDASSFGLLDPQGMTFDSTQGHLYFIDTVGPRLVRVILQPDGSFTDATIDGVNLRGLVMRDFTGLPMTQYLVIFMQSASMSKNCMNSLIMVKWLPTVTYQDLIYPTHKALYSLRVLTKQTIQWSQVYIWQMMAFPKPHPPISIQVKIACLKVLQGRSSNCLYSNL